MEGRGVVVEEVVVLFLLLPASAEANLTAVAELEKTLESLGSAVSGGGAGQTRALGWVWGGGLDAIRKPGPEVVKDPSILGQVRPRPQRLRGAACGTFLEETDKTEPVVRRFVPVPESTTRRRLGATAAKARLPRRD